MSCIRSPLTAASWIVYMAATALLSQNPRTEQDPRTGKSTETTTSSRGDQVLAAWLVIDNENEIALSRLAQERSKSDEVKQFAKKMIDEHQQMLGKLQPLAGTTGTSGTGGTTGKNDRERSRTEDGQPPSGSPTGSDQQPRDASGQRGDMHGQLDVVQLKRELAQRCLASARKELEQKSGPEFDKCFMTMQVMAHVGAVDTLEVFKTHASGQLRQTITEALPTVQAHLEHAKTIAKGLEGKDAGADGKRGER